MLNVAKILHPERSQTTSNAPLRVVIVNSLLWYKFDTIQRELASWLSRCGSYVLEFRSFPSFLCGQRQRGGRAPTRMQSARAQSVLKKIRQKSECTPTVALQKS